MSKTKLKCNFTLSYFRVEAWFPEDTFETSFQDPSLRHDTIPDDLILQISQSCAKHLGNV